MDRLISCEFNMDNACVELKFLDGSMIAIDTIAVENEVADNMYQRSERHASHSGLWYSDAFHKSVSADDRPQVPAVLCLSGYRSAGRCGAACPPVHSHRSIWCALRWW